MFAIRRAISRILAPIVHPIRVAAAVEALRALDAAQRKDVGVAGKDLWRVAEEAVRKADAQRAVRALPPGPGPSLPRLVSVPLTGPLKR